MTIKNEDVDFFTSKMLACPLRGQGASFRIVDELGNGKTYRGLSYKLIDTIGQEYTGILDQDGFAQEVNSYRGALTLRIDDPYVGFNDYYHALEKRTNYPLPITELQVRAEETRFARSDGTRVKDNPAQAEADEFFHVEVRDLAEQTAHLPPLTTRALPP